MEMAPVFFEVLEHEKCPQIHIVNQIRVDLYKRGLTPLPFASTLVELTELVNSLENAGIQPSLFVINTFEAEEQLDDLDLAMGDAAVLFFRRELMWLKAGAGSIEDIGVTTRINQMRPRLTGIWYYGALNFEQVAERASFRIEQYLGNRDFRCFEESLQFSPSGRLLNHHKRHLEQGGQA